MGQRDDNNRRYLKHTIGGTFAGISGTIFGHPLDTVKVRLQTQRTLYNGMIDCLIKILRTEGFYNGLFRGITSPMANMAFLNSIAFGLFEKSKHVVSDFAKTHFHEEKSKKIEPFIAGGMVGIMSSFFSTPFDVVKIRLQLDNITERKLKGTLHAARYLYKNFGLSVFYLGTIVNLCREVLFAAAYFGSYDTLKRYLCGLCNKYDMPNYQFFAILVSGGCAGMLGWGSSFPLDVIKSVKQSQPLEGISWRNRGKSTAQIVKERMKQSGLSGFYRGVSPSLIRAFIVSATRFSVYELVLAICRKLDI